MHVPKPFPGPKLDFLHRSRAFRAVLSCSEFPSAAIHVLRPLPSQQSASHAALPPAATMQPGFSTVNMEELSGLGVAQPVQPDTDAAIADAFLHLHFEGADAGAMELGGILDDAPYTSLEAINTADFRQLLSEGPSAAAAASASASTLASDNQATLLTYPESITRLVSQRRAEGEPPRGEEGGGGSSANPFMNGLLPPVPGEDSFTSMVDLDFSSLLNQLNS
uniref:Uncharacterized protein n=1 Tax=Varanus komodoensis TaxID=61221 RepID=A0A8D2J191_VARKO